MGLEGVEEAVEFFATVDDLREIGQKPAREVMDVEFFARLDGIEQDVAFVIRATVIVADAFDRVLYAFDRPGGVAAAEDARCRAHTAVGVVSRDALAGRAEMVDERARKHGLAHAALLIGDEGHALDGGGQGRGPRTGFERSSSSQVFECPFLSGLIAGIAPAAIARLLHIVIESMPENVLCSSSILRQRLRRQ